MTVFVAQVSRVTRVTRAVLAVLAVRAAKGDVNVTPNKSGLPGLSEATKIVGALLTYGLIAAVAGIAVSAIAWGVGSNSANPSVASRGKTGVISACLAALVIGGADVLVNFFYHSGFHL